MGPKEFGGTVVGKLLKFPFPLLPYFQFRFYHISPIPFKIVTFCEDKLILNFQIFKEEIFFKDIREVFEIAPFNQREKIIVSGGYFYPLINRNEKKGFGVFYERGYIIKYLDRRNHIKFATFIVRDFERFKKLFSKKFPKIKKKSIDPIRPLIYMVEGKKTAFYGFRGLLYIYPLLFLMSKFSSFILPYLLSKWLFFGVGVLITLSYIIHSIFYLNFLKKLDD